MEQVEIRIKDQLDETRSDWFEGMTILPDGYSQTVIMGPVVDQTALFGLLSKVRDLGLKLVSVRVTEADFVEESEEADASLRS